MKEYAWRLRRERELHSWSQEQIAEKIGTTAPNVSRWERGKTFPDNYYRQKLCELFSKNAEELGFIQNDANDRNEQSPNLKSHIQNPTYSDSLASQSPAHWNVPFRRNPLFIGREEVLMHLHETLHSQKAAALTQALAISGLGGIGKTQTAIEYAYRHRDEYYAVLWVRAETRDVLTSDFVAIAELLNIPEKSQQNQSRIVEAVKHWLNVHPNWLLILDNVEDLTVIEDFTPGDGEGCVLLTTRVQSTGMFAQRIDLEKMEENEGELFFLRRAKLLAPETGLENIPAAERNTAKEIVRLMDGLPLALDQAGAYIEETACSLTDYLDRYQSHSALLLDLRGSSVDHPQSIAATLSLSFERIEQTNLVAAELLRLYAFLHPDAIPEEIITEGAPDLGTILQSISADRFKADIAIAELRKYSLLRRNPETKTLTIHRLVQAVLKNKMNEDEQRLWAERAVRAVNRAFPDAKNVAIWDRCQKYLPHAQICSSLIEHWNIAFPEAVQMLNRAGFYLLERGQYASAEALLKLARDVAIRALGLEHTGFAEVVNHLATVYFHQGNYIESEPLFLQAIAINEKALGAEHPSVAQTYNNLAALYYIQGKYAQAEPLYLQAIAITEKALGPEHPDIVEKLGNLAALYHEQGKYAQAEPLLQRALGICEKILGPTHLDTAHCLNNLGELYYDQGKYEQAEPLHQQAFMIREQILGTEHPDVAQSLNNLAKIYIIQGKHGQAEPLLQRALNIRENALGLEHYFVAQSLSFLAQLHHAQGQYTLAEPLYLRALAIREKALGSEHHYVATNLNNFAWLYFEQGKYHQAEPHFQRALAIREKALGLEHPHVATTLENYAALLSATNREDEAITLIERAKEIRAKLAQQNPSP